MEINIKNWEGYQQNDFAAIAVEVLLPVVGQDIVLSVPHQKTVAPVSDGQFYVLIWSAPAGQAETNPPEKIWGIPVDCRDNSFTPAGQGVSITDTETGWTVAELVAGTNLYIHHDLCHNGTDQELQIFRRLCKEVATVLAATPEEKAERIRKIREAELIRSRELWLKECQKRFEKTLEGTKSEIAGCEKKIPELQKNLVEQIRILDGLQKKLGQLNSSRSESDSRYAREFEKLIKIPHIERVTVDSGKICVFTDTLFVRADDGKRYEMGKYRIEIFTDGGNGGVRFFNLTRRVKGYWSGESHHPHVDSNGTACLGNIKEAVPQLLGEYQYSVVAILAIRFLESVNVNDSAGAHIINWPVVSESEEKK